MCLWLRVRQKLKEVVLSDKARHTTESARFRAAVPKRAASEYALFVQSNYKRLKELHPTYSFPEIGKLLSQEYKKKPTL